MQCCSNISWDVLRDVAITSKLCDHLLELSLGLRQLAIERLKKVEQMLGLDATG